MVITFGDSITAGVGASTPSKKWAQLFASSLGAQLINNAVSGGMVPDQAAYVYASNISSNDFATLMLGTNDERIYGENNAKRQLFQSGLAALAAFIASSPIKAIHAGVYSGAWENTYAYEIGKNSYTQGSRCTFSVSGATVLIGYIRQVANYGQFTVKIDGVNQGTFSSNGDGMNTHLGATYGPALLRFAGLTAGDHSVEIEVVSPTSTGNRVYIDWWSGCMPRTTLKLANIPYALAYGSGGSKANVDAYNQSIVQVASDLASYGLSVELIDVNSVLLPTDMFDDYHPNDSGHQKICDAFKGAPPAITFTSAQLMLGSDGNMYYRIADGDPQLFPTA